jgi:hypothetical protein
VRVPRLGLRLCARRCCGGAGDARAAAAALKKSTRPLEVRPGATGMPTAPVLWKPGRGLSALLRAVTSDWTAAPEDRTEPELRPQLPHEAVRGNSPRMASAKVGSQPPAGLSGRREVPNRRKETPRPAWPSRKSGNREGRMEASASYRRRWPALLNAADLTPDKSEKCC